MTSSLRSPDEERRSRDDLRALFEQAYTLVSPFFEPENSWSGRPLETLAFHTLRDRLPELSEADARHLVAAVGRAWRERKA